MDNRCPWPGDNELYIKYHDTEWGVPEYDSEKLWQQLNPLKFQQY